MRGLMFLVVATTAFAVPASAAVDPGVLVLRQADLPGWRLDADNSGPRSNRSEADGDPELRALFERAGRLGGHEAIYNRGSAEISSRVDLFRRARGAQVFLTWFVRQASSLPTKRRRVDVGAEGWVIPAVGPTPFTLVVWRRERAFAGIAAIGVSQERTISLARLQDRRITATLR